MRNQIFLDPGDSVRGTSNTLIFEQEDTEILGIFLPTDPVVKLRVCAEIAEALENVRHAAYSDLQRG